jgi:hypothetical protein
MTTIMATGAVVIIVVASVVEEVDSTRYVLVYQQLIKIQVNYELDILCPLLVVTTLEVIVIGNRIWVSWGQMRDIMAMGMVEGIVMVVVVLKICGIKVIG